MVPPVTILLQPADRKWRPRLEKYTHESLLHTLGLREIFALYIAAIGHDVGHPGVTNVFMVCLDLSCSLANRLNHCMTLEKRTNPSVIGV